MATQRAFPRTGSAFKWKQEITCEIKDFFNGDLNGIVASSVVIDTDDTIIYTFGSQRVFAGMTEIDFIAPSDETLTWSPGEKYRMDVRFTKGTPDTTILSRAVVLLVNSEGYTREEHTPPLLPFASFGGSFDDSFKKPQGV